MQESKGSSGARALTGSVLSIKAAATLPRPRRADSPIDQEISHIHTLGCMIDMRRLK
jgi:hypothetical protein